MSENKRHKYETEAAQDSESVHNFYKTGDETVLSAFFSSLSGRLDRFLYAQGMYRKSSREDIIQESLMDILSGLRAHRYQDKGTVINWAITICRNKYVNYLSSRKSKPSQPGYDEDPFLLLGERVSVVDEEVEAEEVQAEFERRGRELLKSATQVVLALDTNARDAMLLLFYHGLNRAQAAERLDVSIPRYLTRLHRGLAALREWGQKQNAPSVEVYAALSSINTGNLFRELEKTKRVRRPDDKRRLRKGNGDS